MRFCKTCGSLMNRQRDGYWKCSKGHKESDEKTEMIQKSLLTIEQAKTLIREHLTEDDNIKLATLTRRSMNVPILLQAAKELKGKEFCDIKQVRGHHVVFLSDKERINQKIKTLNQRLLTLENLDSLEDIVVARMINPYMDRQKSGMTGNAGSFKIYAEKNKILEDHVDVYYRRGSMYAHGEKENKGGYWITPKTHLYEIKARIEGIDIVDAPTNYRVEVVNLESKELIDEIELFKSDIKKQRDKLLS